MLNKVEQKKVTELPWLENSDTFASTSKLDKQLRELLMKIE